MDTKLDRHMEGTRFKSYIYIYIYIYIYLLALEAWLISHKCGEKRILAMFIKVVSCIDKRGNLGIFGPIITL